MGRSKSFITVELVLRSVMSSQPDTSTEGSGVVSLTREPGRKATVLAHKDLAVGTPGTALCIRRTRTDADGRGRTRTDADILFVFKKFFFFFFFFWAYIYLRAQLERDPESDRLGHPPPPPQLANYMSTMHRYRDGSVQEQVTYNSIRFYRYRCIIE